MQKKKPCIYCGGLTNGSVCPHCKDKLPLVREIQTMVRNKVIEVRGNNGIQEKRQGVNVLCFL